jgi:hypothetical protein
MGECGSIAVGHGQWAARDWWEVDPETGCWQWLLNMSSRGYGRIWADGRRHTAHRYVYEHFHGPIPEGLELDHLCRNKLCVNPDHLEPVTHIENVRRGALMGHGHGGSRPLGRWARHFDACIDCGRTDRRHALQGRCSACRRRWLRQQAKRNDATDERSLP